MKIDERYLNRLLNGDTWKGHFALRKNQHLKPNKQEINYEIISGKWSLTFCIALIVKMMEIDERDRIHK